MPIEFRCQQCSKLLRVPEDSAGRQARCPECGAVGTVPETSQPGPPPGGQSAGAESSGAGQGGSFGPPPPGAMGAEASQAQQQPGQPAPLRRSTVDLGEVFNRAWSIFKKQWGLATVVIVVGGIINLIPGVMVNIFSAAIDDGAQMAMLSVLINITGFLLQTWITVGQVLIFLRMGRGEPVEFGMLFAGGPWLLRAIGGNFLFGLMVGLGVLACIVPGIILALMFWPFLWLIVDRDMGVFESLDQARQVTAGNRMTVFIIGLASMGISLLGFLACFVGAFPAQAFNMLLLAVTYLMMTGQQVAWYE